MNRGRIYIIYVQQGVCFDITIRQEAIGVNSFFLARKRKEWKTSVRTNTYRNADEYLIVLSIR